MTEPKVNPRKGEQRPPEVRARISAGKKRQWARIHEALAHMEQHEHEQEEVDEA